MWWKSSRSIGKTAAVWSTGVTLAGITREGVVMYKAKHKRTNTLCSLGRDLKNRWCLMLVIFLIILIVKTGNILRGHNTELTGPERHFAERTNSYDEQYISTFNRTLNETCTGTGTLDLPASQTEQKISSYEFPGTEQYINDLFPSNISGKMPDFPYFVTAFSSNHFQEGMRLIHNLRVMLGGRYPNFTLIIFDIGLDQEELEKVRTLCNCTLRKFPFENYPDHVKILNGFAWKPLIIQMIVSEHPFVVWLDTSILFTTFNIDPILEKAKRDKVLASLPRSTVASRTLEGTFMVLKEDPCLYRYAPVIQAGLIILFATPYEVKYILKPWVSCALVPGCMVPEDDPKLHSRCIEVHHGDFFKCHRFDQSVWSILLNRLYNVNVLDHIVHNPLNEYLIVSRTGSNITDILQYVDGYQSLVAQ